MYTASGDHIEAIVFESRRLYASTYFSALARIVASSAAWSAACAIAPNPRYAATKNVVKCFAP